MDKSEINDKIVSKINEYDEIVQSVLKKGIQYTERTQITYVKNRISRDIERIAKESME